MGLEAGRGKLLGRPYMGCSGNGKALVSSQILNGVGLAMFDYKIWGAIFGSVLLVLGLQNLGGALFAVERPAADKQGFLIEVAEAETGDPAAGGGEAVPIGKLLASADATKGAAGAKACAACHSFEKGGANKVGPALWDVVERAKASHPGFEYSEGAKAQAGDKWTYDNLNAFLTNPKAYMQGTKMSFGGIKNDAKRADLIAYLASLSDAPKPYPAP
jgi:cytochrome c